MLRLFSKKIVRYFEVEKVDITKKINKQFLFFSQSKENVIV